MPVKKKMLQQVRARGLRGYNDFHINMHLKARAANAVIDEKNSIAAKPVVTRESEGCTVTFSVERTADLAKEHAATAVSTQTGDLLVHMKMFDRTWYWDPDPDASPVTLIENGKLVLRADLRANASDVPVKAIVENELLAAVIGEAVSAYTAIAESIIRGDYDVMTIPLITNGGYIPSETRREHEAMPRAMLETRKKMLVDLEEFRCSQFADCRIELSVEGSLMNPVQDTDKTKPPAIAGPLIGREIIEVVFVVPYAADIYKKHAGEFTSDHRCIDKDDNLYVMMARINGKWHWSPFL